MIQVHAHPNAGGWNGGHGGHDGRRPRVPAHNPAHEHVPERKVGFRLLCLLSTLRSSEEDLIRLLLINRGLHL
jgi:hypothetical protein